MLRYVYILALAFSTLAAALPASAQVRADEPYSVTLGFFFPVADEVSDDSTMAIGFRTVSPEWSDAVRSGQVSFSVDWMQIDSADASTENGFSSVSVVPALVNYQFGLSSGTPWYAGVGAGVLWTSDQIPEMDLNSNFNFAWQLALGANLGQSFFLEGRYLASDRPASDGLFGIQGGYRF